MVIINSQNMSVTLTRSITEPIRGHLCLVRKHVAVRTGASDRTARQLDIPDKGDLKQDIFNVCKVNHQIYLKSG